MGSPQRVFENSEGILVDSDGNRLYLDGHLRVPSTLPSGVFISRRRERSLQRGPARIYRNDPFPPIRGPVRLPVFPVQPPQIYGIGLSPQMFAPAPPPQMYGSDPPPQMYGSAPPSQIVGSDPPPQMYGSAPPPQMVINDPIDLDLDHDTEDTVDVDPEDLEDLEFIEDVASVDSSDSFPPEIIMMSNVRASRFSESSEESSMRYPVDPSAGSPVGFPIESPVGTSPETSPESSVNGSPAGSRATSPMVCEATSSKQTLEDTKDGQIGYLKKEDDAFSCPICMETLTNTGLHKPACLKCGHIFGENCLQRWIKIGCNRDARRCPTCNTRASVKDIRILYTKNLVAVDTAEVTVLEHRVEQENREKNLMHLEAEKWKVKATYLDTEVKRLRTLVDNYGLNNAGCAPTTSRQCIKKLTLSKKGCRVMAFNKHTMMLVVSQNSESPLFNSHVIRKLNASLLDPSKECIFAHKKQIRDMAFHPLDHNILASVSLDKCINLTDLSCNTVVSTIDVNEPLWSCCWAGDNTNVLIAGGQMGSLYYIDRRYMKLFNADQSRKLGCVSLIPIPPSSTRAFRHGGFMKTRMDYLSMFEQEQGMELCTYKETALPMKGLWTSTSYDCNTNIFLSSAKPCNPNKSVRHVVSQISDYDAEGPTVTPLVTFYGGDKATQISRSCLVPSNGVSYEDLLACCYDEISSTIKVFNIREGNNPHNFLVNETFLDLCPLNGVMNGGRRTLAALSESGISVFTV